MSTERVSVLGERGDPNAPPGSPAWATFMRLRLQSKLKERDFAEESLESARNAFRAAEGWRALRDQRGRPFADWATFCATRQPFGLGTSAEAVDAEIVLRSHGGDRKSAAAVNQVDRVKLKGGNQTAYLLARLDRDDPVLAARVRSGELKAKTAARLAGVIKTKTPLDHLRHWWEKARPADRAVFKREITRA